MTDYTRKKNPYKNFIYYLDGYQEKKNISYFESISLTKAIQTNYQTHYSPYFYYVPLHNNPLRGTDSTKISDLSINKYLTWQNQHEMNICDNIDSVASKPIKEKTKIDIPIIKLKSLEDILLILNEYPYLEENEYNIDLKSLHNIKTELTEMNKMIGMEEMKKIGIRPIVIFRTRITCG